MAADGVSIRPMRLKVLYTFDLDHKNNHLARFPQSLDIQTAFIDDLNQIGVVELRTCLDAVLEASPELHANSATDFTIYAYDYSEPDTPLVGQGLLSRRLDDSADAEEMVTGRITKNVMGLFARNAQETLEVKLRFNPVQGTQQARASGMSQDARAWDRPSSPMDTSGLESMQRMLTERSMSFSADVYNRPSSRPSSRSGTPVNPPFRQAIEVPTPRHARRDSFNSGYYSAEEAIDDGLAKKRAKIQQVANPTRSDLNIERQRDSLRVAASTASSVRIHRPVPLNPALALEAAAEDPIRPPTPVAKARPRGRARKSAPSGLNYGVRPSSPAVDSGIGTSENLDVPMSSPEDVRPRSASSTPANIPSSPPVISQPTPSSPQLPPLPEQTPSFLQPDFDIFADETAIQFDEFVNDQPDQFEVQFDMNGNMEVSTLQDLQVPIQDQAVEQQPQIYQQMPPPTQIIDRRGSELPPIPASDPAPRPLHRSATWTGTMSDIPTSDAPTGDETRLPRQSSRSRKRQGKDQTKARLDAAIASGEMPPFCDNCGAIETPAWRRAYRRDFECPWEDVEMSLEDGSCHYKEVIEKNVDGSVKVFKGYKLIRQEGEDEIWRAVSLCNPCGLWFHKQKCMRPQEKWNKRDPTIRRRRRNRNPPRFFPNNTTNPNSTRSDAVTPASDGSSPNDTATEAADGDAGGDQGEGEETAVEPDLPPQRIRSTSAGPETRLGLHQAVLNRRGTRSSPLRPASDPIEIDITPKNVRRQLFPSPNKSKSAPTTNPSREPELPSFVRRSPRLNKTKDVFTDLEAPSTPPRPSSTGHSFRTPGREFGVELSGNIQRTPSRSTERTSTAAILGFNKTPARMTPFTRSIHDALMSTSAEDMLNSTVPLDFPDLPSLNGSSPMSTNPIFQIDFSELTTDIPTDFHDIFSTDAPMPSSPPVAAFFGDADGIDYGLLDPELLKSPVNEVRRSPRKRVA